MNQDAGSKKDKTGGDVTKAEAVKVAADVTHWDLLNNKQGGAE